MRKKLVVSKAESELSKWNGKKETNATMYPTLVDYWKSAGYSWINNSNIAQYATQYPWSSAFISFVMRSQYSDFPKSPSHSQYTLWAKSNRQQGATKFVAYKPNEYKPEPGDIIVQRRGNFTGNLDNLYQGATTHGDIVVSNDGNKIVAIGGNLGDTVTKVSYNAVNGYLNTANHIAVIKV